jgi:hypothetical protein
VRYAKGNEMVEVVIMMGNECRILPNGGLLSTSCDCRCEGWRDRLDYAREFAQLKSAKADYRFPSMRG